jgi:RNA polymerase-binding protein DksA
MNTRELEYLKSIILEKRQEILRGNRVLEADDMNESANNNDSGDLRYTTHMADQGSDTMGKELASYFDARTEKYLLHLDEALRRIEEGTYGICLVCGKQIPTERLCEVPHTRHCIPCKNKDE